MRSKLIIVATVVASLVLASQMAAADQVQEQFRLMEQRMAEMEDRLQATSAELQTAKATVDEQQGLLSEAGLIEEDGDGIRSSVGNFLEQVDISVPDNSKWHDLYKHDIPVLHLDGKEICRHRVSETDLTRLLGGG